MRKFFIAALLGFSAVVFAGEVIFDGSKPEAWGDDVTAKDGVLTINANYKIRHSKDFVPVTRGRKYTISGEFFIPAGASKAQNILYFGVVPFTAKGEEIIHSAIATAIPYSVVTLAADAKAGDKSVTLKDARDWKLLPHGRLAFNAKVNASDLPNFDLSGFINPKKSSVNADGTVTVVFNTPLAKDYPAGTAVRQHRSGNMFVYIGFTKEVGKWVPFSQTVRNFYIGTTQIKPAIRFLNRGWQIQMRNVKIVAE